MSNELGTVVKEPPKDGISALRFNGDLLLAASWDGHVHLYHGPSGTRRALLGNGEAPILDATFENHSTIYCGGIDNQLKKLDVGSNQSSTIGSHDAAIRCVECLPDKNLVATAGWDSSLKLWDPRSASPLIAQHFLPGKAFSASLSPTDNLLVVATAERRVEIFDVRTISDPKSTPVQSRESSLKYQTRCVSCFPQGGGFAISSIEGRVGIEYFDLAEEAQAQKYAFKCHRKVEDGKDVVYPVNTLAYNKRYGTFVTGGGDGVVSFWDGNNKKRLHQLSGYPTSISALAFSEDGALLAVAASYSFEKGELEKPPPSDAIYIRHVAEAEIQPRRKKA